MHIYDFITDKYQYQLKQQAYSGSTRFEETINAYKKLFFENLKACTSSATPAALDPTLIANKSVLNWLECARTNITSDILELEKLFDEVIDGYYLFIRGKHYMASLKYQDLLDKFEIAIDDDIDRLALFFRGFKLNPSRDTFDSKQYYHIPFNLRHLVGNQRFSFSGLPIIYIGASVADIYFEFDEFDLNEKNIALASFSFNPISNITIHKGYETISEKTKIFNITNEIYNLVNDAFLPLIQNGVNLPSCDDELYKPNKKHIKTYFRKFIVSQLCTFPKQRNNSTFYEEYVIPQLFTEALSLHKYDGIIFPSTKFKNQIISSSTPYHNLFYLENLALFSKYNVSDNYDEMLMDNFEIEIIDFKNANTLNSVETTKSISKTQSDLFLELHKKEKSRGKNRMNGALMAIGKKLMCYDSLLINGHKYLETTAGKMELIYTVKYLQYLTSCIRYLNNV